MASAPRVGSAWERGAPQRALLASVSEMVGLPTRKAATDAAREMSTAGSQLASRNAINWDNYNYPPLLHLVHFDLEELESVPKLIVRWCNWSYKLLVVCLFTNCASCSRLVAVLDTCMTRACCLALPPTYAARCAMAVVTNLVLAIANVKLKYLHVVYAFFSARSRRAGAPT